MRSSHLLIYTYSICGKRRKAIHALLISTIIPQLR